MSNRTAELLWTLAFALFIGFLGVMYGLVVDKVEVSPVDDDGCFLVEYEDKRLFGEDKIVNDLMCPYTVGHPR